MGDLLVVVVGLIDSENPADSAFSEAKGKETSKSPPVWPSESGYGGTKISGDPIHRACLQGVLAVPLYLRAFSGVDTGLLELKVTAL